MYRVLGAAGICALLFAAGCTVSYSAPVMPPGGAVTNITAPMSTEFGEGVPASMKQGRATATSILALVSTGDASVEAAARNGGLSTIHYADYSFMSILGLYTKFTTIVHGE